MIALLLAAAIATAPISPASTLVRAARAVRGDSIMPAPTLNHYAQARVGRTDHVGFECQPGARTQCGEILGWVRHAPDPYAWVMQAWLDSPSHRAVLLGSWSRVGAAVKVVGDTTYFAMEFDR